VFYFSFISECSIGFIADWGFSDSQPWRWQKIHSNGPQSAYSTSYPYGHQLVRWQRTEHRTQSSLTVCNATSSHFINST